MSDKKAENHNMIDCSSIDASHPEMSHMIRELKHEGHVQEEYAIWRSILVLKLVGKLGLSTVANLPFLFLNI